MIPCVNNIRNKSLFDYLLRCLVIKPLDEAEEAVAGDLVGFGVAEAGQAGSGLRTVHLVLSSTHVLRLTARGKCLFLTILS